MDRKPWYQREDFWAAIGAALAIILSDLYGVELQVEAFVSIVALVGALIWSTTKVEETAMSYRAEERLADKTLATAEIELQIARLKK